jgi:methyl-accepting chemotaxis protein
MTDSNNVKPYKSAIDRLKGSGGKSLSWRLILPVPITIILCVVAIALIVPRMMAENAREQAALQGQQVANQFKTIRGYYTRNVIKKVVESKSLKPSFNHKSEANGVSQAADESQKSADQVLAASQDVSSNAEKLQKVVDEFLNDVAAA